TMSDPSSKPNISGPPSPTGGPPTARTASPSNLIVATGRARTAGYLIGGGGLAVALSAFLPWVSGLGLASVHLSGGAVVLVLAAGVLLAYFGARVLKDRATRILMIALWILAAVDSLMVVLLFLAQRNITDSSEGLASPGVGLYAAIAGLTATV